MNRGDSFRRRRSRSNSLAPGVQCYDDAAAKGRPQQPVEASPASAAAGAGKEGHHNRHHHDVRTYRVAIIGAHGVGKSALISQFKSSECINAYDRIKNGTSLARASTCQAPTLVNPL